MTQVGHAVIQSMRIGLCDSERETYWDHPKRSISIISKVRRKNAFDFERTEVEVNGSKPRNHIVHREWLVIRKT